MTSSRVRRAWAMRLAAYALVVAGFAPVLLATAAALLPGAQATPVLRLYPEIPPEATTRVQSWLKARRIAWTPEPLHVGVAFAGFGLILMTLGAAMDRRQREVLSAARRQRDDARRRAKQYREVSRIEPTFSADVVDASDVADEQRAA